MNQLHKAVVAGTMVEGKPYRYGLIVAGMSVVVFGLFTMIQERLHISATMWALGVIMLCVGTVWSLCQCYPKVDTRERERERHRKYVISAKKK